MCTKTENRADNTAVKRAANNNENIQPFPLKRKGCNERGENGINIDNRLREELLFFSVNNKKNVNAFAVYTFLLMKANHTRSEFRDRKSGGMICVERGQTMTSTPAISGATGLTEKQVRTAVRKLIDTKRISKKSTKHYTIFTLLNYDRASKRKKEQTESTGNDSGRKADREYYEYLLREIQIRELNDEERDFFNSYYNY